MKLSNVIEKIYEENYDNCTAVKQEDNSWKVTYYRFDKISYERHNETYNTLTIDIDLTSEENFELFSGYWNNEEYVDNHRNGTLWLKDGKARNKFGKKFINLHFHK